MSHKFPEILNVVQKTAQTKQGFNMFLSLYNSLYHKYNFPPLSLSLWCRCRDQMVLDRLEQVKDFLKPTETSMELVWTGTWIGDSFEEVEKWAEKPDLGSPNIK